MFEWTEKAGWDLANMLFVSLISITEESAAKLLLVVTDLTLVVDS
jgi:hypothetical protein